MHFKDDKKRGYGYLDEKIGVNLLMSYIVVI